MRCILFVGLGLILVGCWDGTMVGHNPTPYAEDIPYYFPTMPVFLENPSTVEGVELGRRLYYDKILHASQAMSCSECHHQSNSFTTSASNSLAHINLAWNSSFLWNGKVEGYLEDIMLFEVEEFFSTNIDNLNNHSEYPLLFGKAFGVSEITSKEVAFALAQFFRTLNSYKAKYDRIQLGLESFTPEESDGFDIFYSERGDCFHCHGGALFSDNLFHNNGLDANPANGRYSISNNGADIGKFKTPTLRNIEFTGPYMHDGRYQTLEEVVDFYSHGLVWSPTIDPLMKNVNISSGVNLSPSEKANLILFLKTLSDTSYLTNPAVSDPF